MNTLMNDRGEIVAAVGAPGSVMRMKVERPAALADFARAYAAHGDVHAAFEAASIDVGALGGAMMIRAFIIASGAVK